MKKQTKTRSEISHKFTVDHIKQGLIFETALKNLDKDGKISSKVLTDMDKVIADIKNSWDDLKTTAQTDQ